MITLPRCHESSRLLARWLRWQQQLIDAPALRDWKAALEIALLQVAEEDAYRAWVRHREGCERCRGIGEGEYGEAMT